VNLSISSVGGVDDVDMHCFPYCSLIDRDDVGT
jgi:hypothetical protein